MTRHAHPTEKYLDRFNPAGFRSHQLPSKAKDEEMIQINLNFLGSRSFSQPLDFKLQAEFDRIDLADVPNGFPFQITKLPETLMVSRELFKDIIRAIPS